MMDGGVVGEFCNGKFSERNKLIAYMNSFDGMRVKITIEEYKPTRSNQQNRYCFGVVVTKFRNFIQLFNREQKITKDETFTYLKEHHDIIKEIKLPDGSTIKIARSSTKLSKHEFELFMEDCRALAATWGLEIPLPNESDKDGWYNEP